MDQDQIESLLKQKYESGEAETGLYNTGLQFVVMDVVNGQMTFEWFSNAHDLGNLL